MHNWQSKRKSIRRYKKIKNQNEIKCGAQRDADTMELWALKWVYNLHAKKCFVLKGTSRLSAVCVKHSIIEIKKTTQNKKQNLNQ